MKTDAAGIATGILVSLYSRGGDLFLNAPRKSCQPPIQVLHVDRVLLENFLFLFENYLAIFVNLVGTRWKCTLIEVIHLHRMWCMDWNPNLGVTVLSSWINYPRSIFSALI